MLVLLGGAACAPHRVVTPTFSHQPDVRPRNLRHVELDLCEFNVANRGRKDPPAAVEALRTSLLDYLHEAGDYGAITECRPEELAAATSLERVSMTVRLIPDHETSRSWFLDALFFYPFSGFWPVTPLWGRTLVRAQVGLRTSTTELAPVEVRASAPFSMIFYSWYRTEPVEAAYRRTYDTTFREMARRIARRIDENLPLAQLVITSTPALPRPKDPDDAVLSLAMDVLESEEIHLPERGFRVIAEPLAHSDNLFYRYVGALGGLEASKTGGAAIVESRATTRFSGAETVGSGRATSDGFRFALYQPPDRTGFFFPPRFGFFSQDIEISGFREALPVFGQGAGADIPAVVTDPTTGVPVDINAPITYELRLRSGYLGQGAGFNFVAGTDDLQLFSTIQVAVNAFEVRHTGVTINQTNVAGYSFSFFGSGEVSAQLGLAVPAIHLAIRGAWEFEWFRAFGYPEPLEFQASVAFNPDKMVFERQRVFVDGATVLTFNWQLSAIYSF